MTAHEAVRRIRSYVAGNVVTSSFAMVFVHVSLTLLKVILAFAVGAEVGGIVGAILALPVAAMYPVIEGIWLKDYLGRDAVETHRRIERRKGA